MIKYSKDIIGCRIGSQIYLNPGLKHLPDLHEAILTHEKKHSGKFSWADFKMDFTYYMLGLLFLSFFGLFILNLYRFVTSLDLMFLVWAAIGFAITSLQYFNLKSMYEMRKLRKNPQPEEKIETVDEMLKLFSEEKKEEKMKGGK